MILYTKDFVEGIVFGKDKDLKYIKIGRETYIMHSVGRMLYHFVPKFGLYEYYSMIEFLDEKYSYIDEKEYQNQNPSPGLPYAYKSENQIFLEATDGEVAIMDQTGLWICQDNMKANKENAQRISFAEAMALSDKILKKHIETLRDDEKK